MDYQQYMSHKKSLITQLHTVVLLIGPTCCEKRRFSKLLVDELSKQLRINNICPKVQNISFNRLRNQLTNINAIQNKTGIDYPPKEGYEHHENRIYQVLYCLVKTVTSFPISAHFVVVDIDKVDKNFGLEIEKIVRENHYCLDLINFYTQSNTLSEHFATSYRIIREISSEYVNKIDIRLPHESFSGLSDFILDYNDPGYSPVIIRKLHQYQPLMLNPLKRYLIVGDLHECIDEFKVLITKYGFSISDDLIEPDKNQSEIILVGDTINKGHKTEETIRFLHYNIKNSLVPIHYIRGNHEDSIYNLLRKKFPPSLLGSSLSSYQILRDCKELKQQFLEIVSCSKPFVYYHSIDDKTRSFYVTHAPCQSIYLGKIDRISLKKQRYNNVKQSGVVKSLINPISSEFPYHIFGHLTLKEVHIGNQDNLVAIDTGAIYGNKLTGLVYGHGMEKPLIHQVNFLNLQAPLQETLYTLEEILSKPEECL